MGGDRSEHHDDSSPYRASALDVGGGQWRGDVAFDADPARRTVRWQTPGTTVASPPETRTIDRWCSVVADDIQVLIAGAGIGGLSLAGFLHRSGLDPVVVDRAETLDRGEGALELWPDTMTMLDWLEVGDDVRETGTAVETWTRREPDGTVATRLDAADPPGVVAVRDARLREQLRGVVPDRVVRTDTGLRTFRSADGAVSVEFDTGVRESFDVVVGADGLQSRTRTLLGAPHTPCGTRSYAVPLEPDERLDGASEVWTSDGVVFRALPAGDRPVGWLTVPAARSADHSADAPIGDRAPEIDWLLPDALADDALDRGWAVNDQRTATDVWSAGRIALVGDAAHARHRLAGVGPTLAIEDAAVLATALTDDGDPSACLTEYAARRRARVDRLFRESTRGHPLDGLDPAVVDRYGPIPAVRSARLASGFTGTDVAPAITTDSG